MAAADPVVDLRIAGPGSGHPTAANIAAATADVTFALPDQHWLVTAADGAKTVTWRQCEAAVAAAVYFDRAALSGVILTRSAISPAAIAAFFRAAINNGMLLINKGSVTAALHYFTQHVRAVRSQHPAAFTIDAPGDFVPLAPWPRAALAPPMHPSMAYTDVLEVPMCVDVDGDGLVLSAVIDLLVHRYAPLARAGPLFAECAMELYGAAEGNNPGFATKPPRMQAIQVVAIVGANVVDAPLMVGHADNLASAVIVDFGGKGTAALRPRFLEAWSLAFPHLQSLLTPRCLGREAWAHAARLLNAEPTSELLAGLDSKIGRFMPSIDTDATLSALGAPISSRVAEMDKLLASLLLPQSSSAATDVSGASQDDPLAQAALFALPHVKQFLADMVAYHTDPLCCYRVVKAMLAHQAVIGWQFLQGAKVTHPLFDAFAACKEPPPIVEAYKRHMCKDAQNKIRVEWFTSFDNKSHACPLPSMLINGEFATEGKLNFNPWLDVCSVRIKLAENDYSVDPYLDALAASDPAEFFANEYMLREGREHLLLAFSFIGFPMDGDNSLAAALQSCLKWAERIQRIPNALHTARGTTESLASSKQAMRQILKKAGISGFAECAASIRLLKKTKPKHASRPGPFAPTAGALNATISELTAMMQPIQGELLLAQAISRGLGGMPPPPPMASQQGAVPLSAVGHLPPPAPDTVLAQSHLAFGRPASPDQSTVGPSASQAGTVPIRYQQQYAAQSFVVPRLGWSGNSNLSEATQLGRGSLAHTLRKEGAGVWYTDQDGTKWYGAKHSGAVHFDPSRTCLAALLPPSANKEHYCTGRLGCRHQLGGGYTVVCADAVPHPNELITKRPREEQQSWRRSDVVLSQRGRGANKSRGKGRRGGRKGGRASE